jgi:excisionase family DNA binding protein
VADLVRSGASLVGRESPGGGRSLCAADAVLVPSPALPPSSPPELLPRLLEVDEVARALGVTRWTVYRLATARRIPSVRVGRRVRFILQEVVDALRLEARGNVGAPSVVAEPARTGVAIRPRPAPSAPAARTGREPASHADRIRAAVEATRRLG